VTRLILALTSRPLQISGPTVDLRSIVSLAAPPTRPFHESWMFVPLAEALTPLSAQPA